MRRAKGTIKTNVVPVNKNQYREVMIEKVVPAIQAKWPDRNQNILIQQDGAASSHIDEDDPEFVAVGVTGVWNIRLMTQSPKLPDLIVLDLSFFRALQSKQWSNRYAAETMDELIETVLLLAYDDFEPMTLNLGWLTLIGCYDDVITTHRDNNYELRHMGKDKALRDGRLPEVLIPLDDA